MPGVTYQGQDGQAYKFATDAGALFSAFVAESLVGKLPPVGQRLEIEAETKTSKAGKAYQRVVAINGERATATGGRMGGGGGRPYDARAFVSNVVSSAIEAGLIKEPSQIEAWATEAFSVITKIGPKSVLQETGTASAQGGAPASPTPPGGVSPPNDAIPF